MPRPLAVSRHRAVLLRLQDSETVTVEELSAALGVSRETVRRDLKRLAEQGRLTVVHGGALRRDRSEAPFADRRSENRAGKDAIAALAVGLVADGMSVLLDSGTTTEAIADALSRSARQRLVVHTTSFANARALGRLPGAQVRLIGGAFDPNDDATTGEEVRRAVARLAVDLAFVGVGGIDAEGRVTDYTRAGAAGRGAMIRAAARAYLAADHGKFGRSLGAPIPGDETAAGLLADVPPPAPLAAALKRRGLRVLVP